MKTPYDVLGVPRHADDEAIRAAFRKAAKTYHPDVNSGDPEAEQHVKRIIAAYEVLRDPKHRGAYDLGLDASRRRNARRFLGGALAGAGLASGIALGLVAWESKLQSAFVPVFGPSLSSAREPSEPAVEPSQPAKKGVVSSASTPAPAVEASGPVDQKVAISNHKLPEAVIDLGSYKGTILAVEWGQLAQSGDAIAILGFAARNSEAPEGEFARSWLLLLIEGTDDASLLHALLAGADGEVAERALQRLRRMGSFAVAKEEAPTAAAKDAEPEGPQKDLQFYIARGLLRSGKSDYDGAISDFNRAIGIDPRSALAFTYRAKAWGGKNDPTRALMDFEMAIRIDPTSAAIFRDRGILWRRNGAPARALADFDQAIRLGFSDAVAYNERGQVWLEWGHYERAIADFDRAIKLDANFAGAFANRAIASRSKGDVERALADSNHALRLDPSISLAHRDIAPSHK